MPVIGDVVGLMDLPVDQSLNGVLLSIRLYGLPPDTLLLGFTLVSIARSPRGRHGRCKETDDSADFAARGSRYRRKRIDRRVRPHAEACAGDGDAASCGRGGARARACASSATPSPTLLPSRSAILPRVSASWPWAISSKRARPSIWPSRCYSSPHTARAPKHASAGTSTISSSASARTSSWRWRRATASSRRKPNPRRSISCSRYRPSIRRRRPPPPKPLLRATLA